MHNQRPINAELLFWITIALLAVVYLVLQFGAYKNNSQNQETKIQKSIMPPQFATLIKEYIVDDVSIKKLLENNETFFAINSKFTLAQAELNQTIDASIEKLFVPIYDSVESFLDFHYSIVGEYTQLGYAATGKIEEEIQKRLFGEDFVSKIEIFHHYMHSIFNEKLIQQQMIVEKFTESKIDKKLNSKLLERLNEEIQKSIAVQQEKLYTILGAGMSYKVLVAALSTKIATKLSSKLALKGAIKAGSKAGSVGVGFASGALCGPGALVCAPLFATAVWFGSDELLIKADEMLHREDFKQEIVSIIDAQKMELKHKYQEAYSNLYREQSTKLLLKYKNLPLKKREHRSVKELINLH